MFKTQQYIQKQLLVMCKLYKTKCGYIEVMMLFEGKSIFLLLFDMLYSNMQYAFTKSIGLMFVKETL